MENYLGKDAPLEETLEKFKGLAIKIGLDLVETNVLNPLENVWSVHLEEATCPEVYSNGKGSCKEAALASAYGELFERLGTHMSFSDYFLGLANSNAPYVQFPDEKWFEINPDDIRLPEGLLNASLRKYYTDAAEITMEDLVDLQSSSFQRGVCAIPFTNARSGDVVYFPVNMLDNLYASNGMSAGNTEYEALTQGLSEILERYAKKEIITKGYSLPQVPLEVIQKYENCYATIKALNMEGFKAICYDGSLGGKFPVVCVVLYNQRNGCTFASFGAHPIFEVALERTLNELMQGRTFSDLDSFEEPSFDIERIADPTNLESHFVDSTGILPMSMFRLNPDFTYVPWDFQGDTHEQYKALHYMIDKLGFDIYIRQYTQLGIPIYRIIVPGMSEIYPIDDLIYNNTNSTIDFQEAILSLPSSSEKQDTYLDYLKELEDENFNNEMLVCPSLGILTDNSSPWKNLRVAELKCLMALAGGNLEAAKQYAADTIALNSDSDGQPYSYYPLDRLRFYKCLIKVIESKLEPSLNESDYKSALALVYSTKTLHQVYDHIERRAQFNNLPSTDLDLKGFTKHQALIRIFNLIKGFSDGQQHEPQLEQQQPQPQQG